MNGLMMDYQLTIPAMARRAESMHPHKAVVSRRPDRTVHRTTYAEVLARSRRLIGALKSLGVAPGDRVATYCWNHHQHLEVYYGIPSMGAVLHTLNIRLHADEMAYIVNHAEDSVIIVDKVLWPAFDAFRSRISPKHVVVVGDGTGDIPGTLDYETLIASSPEVAFDETLDENRASGMCYTSGTTGRSKGAVYSHRSTVLHSMASGLWDVQFVRDRDVVLSIVPMFHAMAWGLPYTALLFGASLVLPAQFMDPASVLELIASERVTVTGAVPSVLTGLLQKLDEHPGAYDVSSVRVVLSGGSAVPESLMRALYDRHGLRIQQAWGMTETSPLGSTVVLPPAAETASEQEQYRYRTSAGRLAPFVEGRVRTENGFAPWDGESMGELEVRGPWVVSAYYNASEAADRFTDDGWFRTGDIVSLTTDGFVVIRDRSKDVIKSGGEWISSVALENALMNHPSVAEAMVIGLRHPRWDERPLALVVRRPGCDCSPRELIDHLAPHFVKMSVPEDYEFIDALPRTSVGKPNKRAMRDRYQDYFTATPGLPASRPDTSTTVTTS